MMRCLALFAQAAAATGATPQREIADTEPPARYAAELDRAVRAFAAQERDATAAPTQVNLVFHVLGGAASEGDLGDAVLAQQLRVLNDAYGSSGFHFNLADVQRYPGSAYFAGGCFPTMESGIRMKQELAVDPARFVNVYTCKLALPYIAGYATLPNAYPENDARHGIVLDYATIAGGPAPFTPGHTLVHEMGHYLGLLHTFQGGCDEPGDDVADTPAESGPAYGCEIGRDTCAPAGPDPVTNYMDYSEDACTNQFTPLQNERMHALVSTFRPGLATGFTIGPGMTGNWYNASENGHGFMIEILPGNQMLAAWFVFAPDGGQAWIVGSGPISGDTAVLAGYQGEGPGARFPPNFDASRVQAKPWGTLTFTFSDCSHGRVAWEPVVAGYSRGAASLSRLTLPAGLACP